MKSNSQFDISALVIVPTGCDAVLAPYRKRYTKDGAIGMPAHITVLYPFAGHDVWSEETARRLSEVIAAVRPFNIAFSRLSRFADPRVLYLEPSPGGDILTLTHTVLEAFPRYPPYSGSVAPDRITPHATVAVSPPAEDLATIEKAFLASAFPLLPATVQVKDVRLFVKSHGKWWQHSIFTLGQSGAEPDAAPLPSEGG